MVPRRRHRSPRPLLLLVGVLLLTGTIPGAMADHETSGSGSFYERPNAIDLRDVYPGRDSGDLFPEDGRVFVEVAPLLEVTWRYWTTNATLPRWDNHRRGGSVIPLRPVVQVPLAVDTGDDVRHRETLQWESFPDMLAPRNVTVDGWHLRIVPNGTVDVSLERAKLDGNLSVQTPGWYVEPDGDRKWRYYIGAGSTTRVGDRADLVLRTSVNLTVHVTAHPPEGNGTALHATHTTGTLEGGGELRPWVAFSNRRPSLEVMQPEGGSTVSGTVRFAGNVLDPDGDPMLVTLKLTGNGSNDLEIGHTVREVNGTWAIPWNASTVDPGSYNVLVRVSDPGTGRDADVLGLVVEAAEGTRSLEDQIGGDLVPGPTVAVVLALLVGARAVGRSS